MTLPHLAWPGRTALVVLFLVGFASAACMPVRAVALEPEPARPVGALPGPGQGATLPAGAAAAGGVLHFSPSERARITAHGPWPPAPARDAGNRLAGRPEAIALGRRLFFDPRLSVNGAVACATCHQPALALADGRARSVGLAAVDRHAPSLWNAVFERWYGWDGAADSLWSQGIRPLLDPREMGASAARLRQVVGADRDLACRYRAAVGRPPGDADDDTLLVDVAKLIAAYVGTLVSGRTAFDDFRDALLRGDLAAAASYPLAAQRGLRLFVGRGACGNCHVGPMFSNGEFADIGRPFFIRPGVVDPGRQGGIAALRASRFNLLSAWADDEITRPAGSGGGGVDAARTGDDDAALKTRHLAPQHRNFGEFKVPSLRNVALTAPYMHDGSLATLDEVLTHYSELDLDRLHADGEQLLVPLHLSPGERADLRAFLHTLSDAGARELPPLPDPPCGAAARLPG
ncbi:MAG: hypothetical protein RL375_1236 [Pseudomonadota bacterium]